MLIILTVEVKIEMNKSKRTAYQRAREKTLAQYSSFKEKRDFYKRGGNSKGNKRKAIRKELEEELRKKNLQLNQRMYRLEKEGLEHQSQVYKFISKHVDKSRKPRKTVSKNQIAKMDDTMLLKEINDTYQQLLTATSTKQGIQEVESRRLEMSAESFKHIEGFNEESKASQEEIKRAWKNTMTNNDLYKAFSDDWIPSMEIQDLWYNHVIKNKDVTDEQFVNIVLKSQKNKESGFKLHKKLMTSGKTPLK